MPDIFLYQSAPNVYTVILSDPTIKRFSGTQVNAIGVFLASVLGSVNIVTTSPPVTSFGQTISTFGINAGKPAGLSFGTGGGSQPFYSFVFPNYRRATSDGWGDLGQRAMGGSLLIAPGNGGLSSKTYYVVARELSTFHRPPQTRLLVSLCSKIIS